MKLFVFLVFKFDLYSKITKIYRNIGLREDLSSDKITRKDIMRNALVVEEDYFVAPINQKV